MRVGSDDCEVTVGRNRDAEPVAVLDIASRQARSLVPFARVFMLLKDINRTAGIVSGSRCANDHHVAADRHRSAETVAVDRVSRGQLGVLSPLAAMCAVDIDDTRLIGVPRFPDKDLLPSHRDRGSKAC